MNLTQQPTGHGADTEIASREPAPDAFTHGPPLPVPGTGGREVVPGASPDPTPRGHRGGCGMSAHGGLRGFALTMALLIGIWALSGGGHFWPGWVLLGWGAMLITRGPGNPLRRDRGYYRR